MSAEPVAGESRLNPEVNSVSKRSSGVDAIPTGFYTELIAPGYSFSQPVGVTFSSDGRIFVVEKRGRVYIVEDGVKQAEPFIDLESEVLNHWDRGLLGFELDPNFDSNGRVYLLYTYDRDGSGDYQRQDVAARLTRYTVDVSNPNQVDPASRKILIGETFAEGIPSCYYSHTIGTIQFGSDGSLLVGAGDGADFGVVDSGGLHEPCFGEGLFPASEDIGAFRSQRRQSLAGKILRVDPETGFGLPSNPFYTGNPEDNESKVWAVGLRNPYRFSLRTDGSTDPDNGQPGTLFIGDVGWGTWEDLHVSHFGGENFGWPCYEGPLPHSAYQSQDPADTYCVSPPFSHDAPPAYWHHSNTSISSPGGLAANAIVVGDIYTGYRYPAEYVNRLFYADYTRGWISSAAVSEANNLSDHEQFGSGLGAVVDIRFDESSSYLYWVNVSSQQVYRLRHDDENAPPVSIASASRRDGYAPVTVQFSGSASYDPNSDPLTYEWDFGDGATSTEPNPEHTFVDGGVYQVSLTVSDDRNASDVSFLQVAVNNTYPTALLLSPTDGASFKNTDSVVLEASGVDAEDGGNLTFDWLVTQKHNTHSHSDFFVGSGAEASFALSQHGTPDEVSYLEIRLIATDSGGLTDTVHHHIEVQRPDEVDITGGGTPFASVSTPTGLGNPELGVISDGVVPDTNASDPLLHYDTYDGSIKDLDWIGYTFSGDRYISKLTVQQGVQTGSGGWFDSLSVEIRTDGIWEPVSYLSPVKSYQYNNGVNFDQYTLLFEARWGDAVRLIGTPGGSDQYVSIAELRVFGLTTPAFVADVRRGSAPLDVQFTDMSTIENALSWQWDFGDGNTGYGISPTHTYSADGSYDITLTVHDHSKSYTEFKAGHIIVGSSGLLGEYFDDAEFSGTRLVRVDPDVNFSWASGAPDPSMGANDFSIRWTGWVEPTFTETYTFITTTDDGVRLWVGGNLLIDRWIPQSPTEWTATMPLEAGVPYPVVLEYYEAGGGATAILEWESASQARQVIPATRLTAASIVPSITQFTPSNGDYGVRVIVKGQNLDSATSVSFNGMAATFGVESKNKLWADVPSGATSGPITVQTPNGTTQRGTFFVNDAQLPIQLSDLQATVLARSVTISWRAEQGNQATHFIVEQRRSDAEAFHPIGAVMPKEEEVSYSFVADLSEVGEYTFRVQSVDAQGSTTYSPEVVVQAVLDEAYEVVPPYPNPFGRELTLGFTVRDPQRVRIELYDMLGRRQAIIFDEEASANQRQTVRSTELNRLPSGVYVIRIAGEGFRSDYRVVHVD